MDPVSALGVAAAAVQFLQFSLQILDTCRQIREDAECSTAQNKALERAIRTTKESRRELEISKNAKAHKRIAEIARKCVEDSDELIRVLEHVRGVGKPISAWKATLRTMRETKTIEKLRNSLNEKQESLDRLLLQGIWTQTELTAVAQRDDFEKLNQSVQALVQRLLNVSQDFTSLKQLSQARFNQSDRLMTEKFERAEAHADTRQRETERKMQQRDVERELQRQHEKLLNSLFFEAMHTRRASIKDAAPKTLQWIFDRQKQGLAQWDDLPAWLRDDASTCYWICGKLGSGKSTLMAHLVGDPRTSKELRKWSHDLDLHILSFYFWRAGSDLQKSIVGLLRSLLYQICQEQPEVATTILSHLKTTADRLGSWTEKSLRTSIITAISSAEHARFCLFIDGLDEYVADEGYGELTSLIFNLANLQNAKCCVSSRPEVPLSKSFEACRNLRLEHLNYHDIESFMQQQLKTTDLAARLQQELTSSVTIRANGVFLWAALVVRDLIDGAISGDDETMLNERLRGIPNQMEDAFRTILAKVDRVHRKSLAFYVKAATMSELDDARIIPYLAAADTNSELRPLAEFYLSCRRLEVRIASRSAGLLELSGSVWRLEKVRRNVENQSGGAAESHSDTVERILSEYQDYPIGFVHRSAYDFICSTSDSQILGEHLPSNIEVAEKLLIGACKFECEAQYDSHSMPEGKTDFGFALSYITQAVSPPGNRFKEDTNTQSTAARALDSICQRLASSSCLVFEEEDRPLTTWKSATLKYTKVEVFWAVCGVYPWLDWYVMSKLQFIFDCPRLQTALSIQHLEAPWEFPSRPWSHTIARQVTRRLLSSDGNFPRYEQVGVVLRLIDRQSIPRRPSSISLDCLEREKTESEDFQTVADSLSYAVFVWSCCPYISDDHRSRIESPECDLSEMFEEGDPARIARPIFIGPGCGTDHLDIQISAHALPNLLCGRSDKESVQKARIVCFTGGNPKANRESRGNYYYGYHVDPPKAVVLQLEPSTSHEIFKLVANHVFFHRYVRRRVSEKVQPIPDEDGSREEKRETAFIRQDRLRAMTKECRELLLEEICRNKQGMDETTRECALACVMLHFESAVNKEIFTA